MDTIESLVENSRETLRPEEIALRTPYIGLEHMPRRSITLREWAFADGVESAKVIFKTEDILFGKLRPYFHKVGVALVDGVCSTDIFVLRSKLPAFWSFVLGH